MLNLDGIWEFSWNKRKTANPVYDTFASVPGCFDAAGLHYLERGYACYRKRVSAGGRLRLKVGSFGLHIRILWDGETIGESYHAWSPCIAEFETEQGEHELVLCVDNIIARHPLFREIYDFYGFGGIYDHVTLEQIQPEEIRTLQVLPLDHTTGEVELRIATSAPTLTIAFDGKICLRTENRSSLRIRVPDFHLWSPEDPHLHTVTVNEKSVEFGLRTLDWKGRRLLLNGKEIKLRGLNRHESHPEFGPATPESLIASDLIRIKKAGFNFIRGSHYPQRDYLFQMCDRLGIMVWEEPLAWGNQQKDLADKCFLDTLAAQLKETIRNSFNHPSLIIHGFLNECASDTDEGIAAVQRMVKICHEEDPTRPATFASNRPRRDRCFDFVDMIAMNVYPAWYGDGSLTIRDIPAVLDQYAADFSGRKPIVISEIGAGAIWGEHNGAPWSEEYQADYTAAVMRTVLRNPAWSGVMLWLYCNANTYTGTEYMTRRPRGFNNKGLLDEYRRPKLAWKEVAKENKKGKEK